MDNIIFNLMYFQEFDISGTRSVKNDTDWYFLEKNIAQIKVQKLVYSSVLNWGISLAGNCLLAFAPIFFNSSILPIIFPLPDPS